MSIIKLIQNLIVHCCTKYIDLDHRFIEEKYQNRNIEISYILTIEQ
uniref:Uncharacterized protein n=1 Tax=Physcomitrium patens TaxID=3218 RepID=A0A2K1K5L1_PHYPA|nr:hypothetical protein PHYPA_010954 [Physcomitrium patens]